MARNLRVEFPGAIYHVTCRMVGDAPSLGSYGGTGWPPERCLFRDDDDRFRFLDCLSERVEQHGIRLYLFVLMTNHFHLVFETPEGNCSKFMQSLTTAYTVYYNLRHHRHGHLFDGRYKARLVDGDDYLLALSRYVHLNPVHVADEAGKPIEERIQTLRAYRWSSYLSYIGKRKAFDFVEYGPLLSEMSGRKGEWPKRYREFVESGLAESDEEFKVALKLSPRSIGGDQFRAWIDELHLDKLAKQARPEDVSFRHITEPLPANDVLEILAELFDVEVDEFSRRRHGSPLRAVAARLLIRFAGLSQRDVADLLEIGSGSAVSKQLAALPAKVADDRRLRRLVKKAEGQLEALRQGRCSKP
jgi:putative transposase